MLWSRLSYFPVQRHGRRTAILYLEKRMNALNKQLIESTWQKVAPIADTAAALFYRRLFEIDPGLRPLFAGVDMDAQHRKLVQGLSAVVEGLDDIDRLRSQLETLGRRHIAYGATAKHYDSVGSALLWTLEQGLGDAWNEAAEAAWREAYGLIAGIMQDAATALSGCGTEDEFAPRTDFKPAFII